MSQQIFRPARYSRGQVITIARKPTLSRRAFETKRREQGSKSSLPQHRRRGYRQGGSR